MIRFHTTTQAAAAAIILSLSLAITPLRAADPAPPGSGGTSSVDQAELKQEELDQMLAPLALYPDSLLTQVLMASTYPIEIVQADRWAKAHKDLKGDALAKELDQQKWDPSVRSLVNFPDVLASLSEKLEWTTKIGDAFIADQKRVMETVQKLRGKAQAQGNLKSNDQQVVTVQQQGTPAQVIVVEAANPQTVYVPVYNPTVVYGAWWYPAYPPPYYYRPPGYVATAAVSFGVGVACGAAWGYAWGHCNWGHGDVNINVNQNTNFNNTINRSNYAAQYNKSSIDGKGGKWQHDSSHRQGVAYRDQKTAQKFGGASSREASQARDQFRGRAETGRQDLGRGDADRFKGTDAGRDGGRDSGRASGGLGNRGGDNNRAAASDRGASSSRAGAFEGSNRSGSSERAASQRGQSSRGTTAHSGGGSRSGGGGGARSGGGARGGGGRR